MSFSGRRTSEQRLAVRALNTKENTGTLKRFEGKCPKCKSRNKKIISGRDFVVKNIAVETNNG